jgi:hypothetical protein
MDVLAVVGLDHVGVAAAGAGTPLTQLLGAARRVDDDLAALADALRTAGFAFAGPGVERSSDGRPCLFLHPRSTGGVLVELVQGPRP